MCYLFLLSNQQYNLPRKVLHFKKVKTGMTPAGEMYMTSSSFHTENCWMYFGRQPISHAPYLCMLSAWLAYLSAGLIIGALSPSVESGFRGACRMLGVSEVTSTGERAVTAKLRTKGSLWRAATLLALRKAADSALLLETLIAIVVE